MIQPIILEKLEELPEPLQTEVLHYIEFLIEKYAKTESSQEQIEKLHGYGSWADQIVMSEDFDAPLEDLKEYM
jgi:hypothetical protein